MSKRIAAWLFSWLLESVAWARGPDFIVGANAVGGAYLRRWYLTPWRGWYRDVPADQRTRWQRAVVRVSRWLPNLYLHQFLRDDDDRALHDHPSWAVSFILTGRYVEHTIAAGGIHRRQVFGAGSLRYLPTTHAHRIELLREGADALDGCWTLFLFGPTCRQWGFHCPERGWVHWEEFTAAGAPGEVGKGCDA
ncbi:hypothetical protein DYQ93_11625 [Xanthomonas sp. LMG 8992]|uniref:hypothetical protein n=1 Tax=Xanthomonas sp. LMG 8992 TaxID=1591157 RepID=UPI00136931E7|nr:hypothetical protein [Xanthomonas sp. LMG 8992]MXV11670.1 hypothetical protein [Xanthomonas sp. LMG 8992]